MPLLSYPTADFTPFTKILSTDVNGKFNAVKTLLNTTKLDDTNLQDAGTSITKLKVGTGTAGQFISNNGTTIIWSNNPISAQYNVILGSAAQVTAGTATHSTFASVTQTSGDRLLILPGYATTENWTVTTKLYIHGFGTASLITGSVTFSATADDSRLLDVRATDNITLQAGADRVICKNVTLASGKSFLVDSTVTGELVEGIQET